MTAIKVACGVDPNLVLEGLNAKCGIKSLFRKHEGSSE
jgi:hypothetical protein